VILQAGASTVVKESRCIRRTSKWYIVQKMVIAPKEYSRRRAARGIEVSGVRCTGKVYGGGDAR